MKKKKNINQILFELLKKYPQIKSGRKNFKDYNLRIEKTLKLINKYNKKN